MNIRVQEEPFPAVVQIDPRARIAVAFFLSAAAALSPNIQSAVTAVLAGGAFSLVMVRPLVKLIKRILAVNLFLALLWLTLPFSTPGSEVFSFGPFTSTREGLSLALLVTLKGNGAALFMTALLGSVTPDALARGMRGLGAPGKLALLFSLTTRYMGLVLEEHEKVKRAMSARGFFPKMKLRDYRTLAHGAALSFLRGADQAEHIRRAMLSRGFTGRSTVAGSLRFTGKDWIFFLAALSVFALIVFAGFHYG